MELQVLEELILEEFNEQIGECGYCGEDVVLTDIADYKEIHFKDVDGDSDWRDEGKYSYREDVYRAIADGKELDVYILVSKCRCGSYFTDYEYFNELGELVEPMESVEVVKKWIAVADAQNQQEKTMELQILAQSIPVIKFNKEGLKLALQEHLEKYGNLVVTSETEKDCKKVKAELGKLETAIETFRKETKKALSEPIANFEADCKELVALIQEVKKPIDTQLKEIEEQRKAEKEGLIREEIAKIVVEYELDEKHASQIDILATYLNKSTSMNKIITDLKNRAETLKIAQMSMSKNKEVIKSTCAIYSGKLKQPLDYEVWMERLDEGQDIATLLEKIHEVGKQRLVAELEEQEREAREILNQPEVEPVVHEEPVEPIYKPKPDEPIMSATIKLYGTAGQFKAFKNIMASIGMHYEIIKH